jgi:hypothetical protein
METEKQHRLISSRKRLLESDILEDLEGEYYIQPKRPKLELLSKAVSPVSQSCSKTPAARSSSKAELFKSTQKSRINPLELNNFKEELKQKVLDFNSDQSLGENYELFKESLKKKMLSM